MECSGISIDKVTKSGDTITLYISGLFEKDKMNWQFTGKYNYRRAN